MDHPILYEIHTRCWLSELSQQVGGPVTLDSVPDAEVDRLHKLGITHVWLMGVWATGPRTRKCALSPEHWQTYRQALPDCTEEDIVGSPYAVAGYKVSETLGGESGLRAIRSKLRDRNMKLLLDFIPNHVGLDHPWLHERPELIVQTPPQAPGSFYQKTTAGDRWFAQGRDPYFPPWTDTVQLDYRKQVTWMAMAEVLATVAQRCDGVRCDMAMLILSDVFARTWAGLPLESPAESASGEFWKMAIDQIRKSNPSFIFLAEAYWGLEGRLQSLGFDFTYDKGLYDDLVHRHAAGVTRRLQAGDSRELKSGAHFLENHDEPRVASILTEPEIRAAALVILALPGIRFLQHGQFSGARIRTPVQLGRFPAEPPRKEIEQIYSGLLQAMLTSSVGRGNWVIPVLSEAWPGNPTAQNMVVLQWQSEPSNFTLAVINLAPHRSQCYARLNPPDLADHDWRMVDLLGSEEYRRSGQELARSGLYLDLPEHAPQLFRFEHET